MTGVDKRGKCDCALYNAFRLLYYDVRFFDGSVTERLPTTSKNVAGHQFQAYQKVVTNRVSMPRAAASIGDKAQRVSLKSYRDWQAGNPHLLFIK